jgi:hypothetical protein
VTVGLRAVGFRDLMVVAGRYVVLAATQRSVHMLHTRTTCFSSTLCSRGGLVTQASYALADAEVS